VHRKISSCPHIFLKKTLRTDPVARLAKRLAERSQRQAAPAPIGTADAGKSRTTIRKEPLAPASPPTPTKRELMESRTDRAEDVAMCGQR
jgi:hypothetical protein